MWMGGFMRIIIMSTNVCTLGNWAGIVIINQASHWFNNYFSYMKEMFISSFDFKHRTANNISFI